jgi:hypothetical protein
MAVKLRRKLYPRGGSFETTVPIQLLFSIDLSKKNDVLFEFDPKSKRWFVDFQESKKEKIGRGLTK